MRGDVVTGMGSWKGFMEQDENLGMRCEDGIVRMGSWNGINGMGSWNGGESWHEMRDWIMRWGGMVSQHGIGMHECTCVCSVLFSRWYSRPRDERGATCVRSVQRGVIHWCPNNAGSASVPMLPCILLVSMVSMVLSQSAM